MDIRSIEFSGGGDAAAAIELRAAGARMVVVHGVGPRIAWFGAARLPNFLFWDESLQHHRGDWYLRGGHRLWLTRPSADESEETYEPDNARCTWQRRGGGIEVVQPPTRAGIEKTLAIRERDGRWIVEHRLRNVGTMLWSGGAWALTCTRPDARTRYRVPFGAPQPGWDAVTMVMPRAWGGDHTSRLADSQLVMKEDALEIRPRRAEAKRMLRTRPGTLEMLDDARGTFRIHAVPVPGGAYPLDCNVAVYIGRARFMVELETMSPLTTLAPGERLIHRETWALDRAPA